MIVYSFCSVVLANDCHKTLPNDNFQIRQINLGKTQKFKSLDRTFYVQVDKEEGEFIVNHYYYNQDQRRFMIGESVELDQDLRFVMAEWTIRLTLEGCLEIEDET
ncbi:MAG: hypothetical protein ISR65_16520 [Bacteriovoracaceae bacterium]|nr:hypothetical protein [Bacteriovoracaceae bacterium]